MAFTNEQMKALSSTGKTIVSASAGSGKTTVMIEKIIRLIENGCHVKEVLAVTFTKKAASQMKEKLSKALITAINTPGITKERRTYLKEELNQVTNADISTIHSFCSRLIRAYFYEAGIDSAFRSINGADAEGTALKNRALDELFEEIYENKEEEFLLLLQVYWRKKSDKTLRKIILSLHDSVRNRSDYLEYLRKDDYTTETFDAICEDLLSTLKEKCAYYLTLLEKEWAYFLDNDAKSQIALCEELKNVLERVIESKDYFTACKQEKGKFTVNRSSKKDDKEKTLHVKRLSELKRKIVAIYDDELSVTRSKEEELDAFLRAGKIAVALGKCVALFDEKYDALKKEKGVLDYSDLEHTAIRLLRKNEIAEALQNKYQYVFVDEYQDVNPVQEEIITLVSNKNLFLVGDVKQSIYGFRGSKSKFFVEKQKQFSAPVGESLFMRSNFRSSDAVLNAVNSQFSLAMNKTLSEVNYAKDSFMERGGVYAINDGRMHLHKLPEEEKKKEKETRGIYSVREKCAQKKTASTSSAKLMAQIIKEELSSKIFDPSLGDYRYARYSDIAVLSRKKQGEITKTVAGLIEAGIPVTSPTAINVCDYPEVKTLMDILSLLDNAEQDVPLCSALLSVVGELTANELVDIRLAYPKETYFRRASERYALEKEDVTSHKLRRFYERYKQLRKLTSVLDAGEILTKILTDFRMETTLLSRGDGVSCLKRIRRFIEESYLPEPLCLHAFLEKLKDLDYVIEFSENGGEDSVHVLTMHASKGLEFPIVIIDNINAPFRGVVAEEVFVESDYGLAPRAYDTEKMTKSETLLRRLHTYKEDFNERADELNLYYVALTRAQYALHVVYEEKTLLPDVRYGKSFAEFTDFSVWEEYDKKEEIFDVEKQEKEALVFRPDEELARNIMDAFTWRYTHTGYENLPVKSSATALMNQTETLEQGESFMDKSEFSQTGREAGIAYHAFLEGFDFSTLFDKTGMRISKGELKTSIENTLKNLQKKNVDVSLLSQEKLCEILSNEAFYDLQEAKIYKERQFLVSLPVNETYRKEGGVDDEEMIFQGAIDLLALREDSVHIIDYKYSIKDAEALKKRYKAQLDLYRMATSKILGIDKSRIRCTIVNIYRGFQVDLE